MSRSERETEPEEQGISERLLELSRLYSSSAHNGDAFDRGGTVVPRDSDDRLTNMHLRQTEAAAAALGQSVAAVALRTEIPSFDSIRPEETGQNGREKWPGEKSIEAGERPMFEPERPQEPNETEKIESRAVQYGLLALSALKSRVSRLASSVRGVEINPNMYGQAAKKPLSAAKTSVQTGLEKGREWITDEERQKKLKKSVLALGGVALTAAAVVYAEQKGLPGIHHSQSAHEAAKNSTPGSAAVPKEFTVPLHVQAIAAQAAHHAHKAAEVYKTVSVKAGMGYTQVIQKLKPGHSASEYFGAYKGAIHKFGPGFIKGISHYRQADNTWGLSGHGKAEISGKALRFISDYLKTNR